MRLVLDLVAAERRDWQSVYQTDSRKQLATSNILKPKTTLELWWARDGMTCASEVE
jgi:hypothetical protein